MSVRKPSWRRSVRLFSVLAAAALLPALTCATQRETISTVSRIYAYTQLGTGDVMVEVATAAPGCTGFWFTKNDAGFNATYALLLAAYHTQSTVRISGDDAELWAYSGSTYCRMKFAAQL